MVRIACDGMRRGNCAKSARTNAGSLPSHMAFGKAPEASSSNPTRSAPSSSRTPTAILRTFESCKGSDKGADEGVSWAGGTRGRGADGAVGDIGVCAEAATVMAAKANPNTSVRVTTLVLLLKALIGDDFFVCGGWRRHIPGRQDNYPADYSHNYKSKYNLQHYCLSPHINDYHNRVKQRRIGMNHRKSPWARLRNRPPKVHESPWFIRHFVAFRSQIVDLPRT